MNFVITEYKKEIALICFIFVGLIATLCFCDSVLFDELEHLRSSYFVSMGEAPYRDFFEHHHPLIWYLFAPIIKILPYNNIIALYCAKSLSFSVSCATTYIIFLLVKRFFGGTKIALWTLLLYFFYFPTWYMFSIFKPDTFSRFFFIFGLYLFFCYSENFRRKYLIWCAICFTISFLFLQTAIFYILPLALPLFYICCKNKRVIIDCAISSIIPLLCISIFAVSYFLCGIWQAYFESNWIFNSYLFGILHTENSLPMFSLEIFAAVISLFYLLCKNKLNFHISTVAVLFGFELWFRVILPPPYPHYLVILFLYAAIIISYAINLLNKKVLWACLYVILFVNTLINYAYIYVTNNSESLQYLREYNKNPTAPTVVFDNRLMSIFAPKTSYYWFYPNFCYVDNAIFQRYPNYDINQEIINQKPLYIAYQYGIHPKFNWTRVKEKYSVHEEYLAQHNLRTELLNDYTEILPNLYQRKVPTDQ
ncbi:MAG: glycosyltransferase family 39 protein [Alphaproteobacteria bacterium]|nr:glycosyltransferase family 39 protein [Alphaproteobacteria bacterium]